jgi:hypothetical protein
VLQLRGQTFVESHRGGLCAVVVHNRCHGHVGCHACNGHDVAVVLLDHGRQELPDRQEVGKRVDLERPADGGLWLIENGHGIANSGIIDQDRRLAMGLANLSPDRCEVLGRRDVGLVEVDASFEV